MISSYACFCSLLDKKLEQFNTFYTHSLPFYSLTWFWKILHTYSSFFTALPNISRENERLSFTTACTNLSSMPSDKYIFVTLIIKSIGLNLYFSKSLTYKGKRQNTTSKMLYVIIIHPLQSIYKTNRYQIFYRIAFRLNILKIHSKARDIESFLVRNLEILKIMLYFRRA